MSGSNDPSRELIRYYLELAMLFIIFIPVILYIAFSLFATVYDMKQLSVNATSKVVQTNNTAQENIYHSMQSYNVDSGIAFVLSLIGILVLVIAGIRLYRIITSIRTPR